MSTATRVARILVLTALVLVVPVTAAQARPYIAPTAPATPQASLTAIEHSLPAAQPAPQMSLAAIDAALVTAHPGASTEPRPVVVAAPSDSNGFNWGAVGIGVGIAIVLLGTAALATPRVRGRLRQA
jgi:hypothetical protein